MMYFIGGVPRVGKSTLANMLLEKDTIAYIDTDWIISMLMFAAPKLGIKYAPEFNNKEFIKKAENFFPFLYQFVKYNQFVVNKYTIEGDSFLPAHIHKLQKDFSIRACFLGVSTLKSETLMQYTSKNNWIKNLTREQLSKLCNCIISMSGFLQKECESYTLPYFDLSRDYQKTLEKAYTYLIN